MSHSHKTVRIQVVVDAGDRAAAEEITYYSYGLALSQFLRMVVKLTAKEKIDVAVIAQLNSQSTS